MNFIQLAVNRLSTLDGTYQTLSISLTQPAISVTALAAVQLPADLDLNREVIIEGQGPNWLHLRLALLCRQAPWVGCYAARDQVIVVVHSRVAQPTIGDSFTVQLNQAACPAILIGGPPNSGKSVFSNLLRRCLQQLGLRVFLHRASWDGEGNWAYEVGNASLVDTLVQHNEYRIHEDPETAKQIPDFYQRHARTVGSLRRLTDCLLVDVGGLTQPEKVPLLEQCTDYIVISRLPDAVEQWQTFCKPYLNPLVVIHSVLDPTEKILKEKPFLEIIAGPWLRQQPPNMPEAILNAVEQRIRENG